MNPIPLFIILLLSIIFVACDWRKANDCYNDYKFTIPFKLFPENDTFRIGDTIWLESVIPAMPYDSISEQDYSLGDFEHKIFASLHIYDNPSQWLSGSDNFDYYNVVGSCMRYNRGGGSGFKLLYKRNNLVGDSLKLAFVPTQTGLYSLITYVLTMDYYTEEGIISKKCTEALDMCFRTNNADSLNNYRLLIGYPNITPTETAYLGDGGYAFRVIE